MELRRSTPVMGLILTLVISLVPAPAQKLGKKAGKSSKASIVNSSADKSGVVRRSIGFSPSGAVCSMNMPVPISPGQTINGALATTDCRLPDNSYFDEYTFTASAGQQVSVAMSSTSFDTYLILVNPDNTTAQQDDDGGGGPNGWNSRIPAGSGFTVLSQTGTYSILANSLDPGITGPYSVTLTFGSGGTVCPPTPTTIANGQTINGTLSATDCTLSDNTAYDSYSFTANAGQQVAITMTGTAPVDPYLFLVTPDGNVIGEDDNGGGGTTARLPPIAGTFGSLPATGTYTILANTALPGQFGNYAVTLNISASGSCPPVPISFGQTLNGTLATTDCRLVGDGSFFDSYTFSGTAGQQIAIAMTSTSFDAFLILLSPAGVAIATDDNNGGGTNARIPGASGALSLPATGTYTILANSAAANETGPYAVTLSVATAGTVQLGFASYAAGEGVGSANVSVTRTGDLTLAASVDYKTSDTAALNNCSVTNVGASARCDYAASVGTMHFAVGQSSRTISIPLVDDSFAEGDESFTITLSNAVGATLGGLNTAPVTIQDNEGTNGPNPIDQTPFFVRQHYIDFLGREPDPPGFIGWQAVLNNCAPNDTSCDRIHVSAAFFQSPEFQERGYFVYRFYPVSFGRKPDYAEFVPDIARVSGFLNASELEAAKVAFITEFMARPAFVAKFVTPGLSDTQYVDLLISTAGVTVAPATRDNWIVLAATSRAQVLRQISESTEVYSKYYNQAFVVMQYFGYLRRDPDALYLNWIQVLDSSGDSRGMINGFMNSTEYRIRFGP